MIERKFIEENIRKVKLEEYFKRELDKAGFTELEINKTPLVTRITLNVAKPGLAIGKGGKNIKIITDEIKEKFGIENPQIEINEIKNPYLDAKATIDNVIKMLERGYSWRSVVFRTIDSIMEAGAEGTEIVIKGKLTGKGGRKARNRVIKGYMKKVGDQTKLVDYEKGTAYLKAGAIGLKLRIVRPNTLFPDKIKIKEYIESHGTDEAKEMIRDKTAKAAEAKPAEEITAAETKPMETAMEIKKPAKEKAAAKKEGKEKLAAEKEGKETKGTVEGKGKPAAAEKEGKEKSMAGEGKEKAKAAEKEAKEIPAKENIRGKEGTEGQALERVK